MSDVLQRCEALLLQSQVQFVIAHAPAGARGELDAAGVPSLAIGSDLLLPVQRRGAPERALLGFSDESGLGRIVRQVLGAELAAAGWQPVFTAHLASVLKTMALDGRGLAWLPRDAGARGACRPAACRWRARALAHRRGDPPVPRRGAARMPHARGVLAGGGPAARHTAARHNKKSPGALVPRGDK